MKNGGAHGASGDARLVNRNSAAAPASTLHFADQIVDCLDKNADDRWATEQQRRRREFEKIDDDRRTNAFKLDACEDVFFC